MQGSRVSGTVDGTQQRSIPARAGEPATTTGWSLHWRVYPRPCGGAAVKNAAPHGTYGLSPPVRGSLRCHALTAQREGSIPARAGEPGANRAKRSMMRSIPARAGEPLACAPRTRGNGSIPARAGEPLIPDLCKVNGWVYPRPCGGAGAVGKVTRVYNGLSPPVRGSPALVHIALAIMGSIPARAGEPSIAFADCTPASVYPRPCGGAFVIEEFTGPNTGLSPPRAGSPPQ